MEDKRQKVQMKLNNLLSASFSFPFFFKNLHFSHALRRPIKTRKLDINI